MANNSVPKSGTRQEVETSTPSQQSVEEIVSDFYNKFIGSQSNKQLSASNHAVYNNFVHNLSKTY